MANKDNAVKQLTGGIKMLFKNNKVTHLEGETSLHNICATKPYSANRVNIN